MVILRPVSRQRGEQFLARLGKQQAHSRPGGVNFILLEQSQDGGNGLANPQQILSIAGDRQVVAHSPGQFEIERNNQRGLRQGFHHAPTAPAGTAC